MPQIISCSCLFLPNSLRPNVLLPLQVSTQSSKSCQLPNPLRLLLPNYSYVHHHLVTNAFIFFSLCQIKVYRRQRQFVSFLRLCLRTVLGSKLWPNGQMVLKFRKTNINKKIQNTSEKLAKLWFDKEFQLTGFVFWPQGRREQWIKQQNG